MSDPQSKLRNYYARGERPLSIEEAEQVLAQHPWLRPPSSILILDGDIGTRKGTAVGMTPLWEKTIFLTPVADQETVLHELVHNQGFGEAATQRITPLLMLKGRFTFLKRPVHYEECYECETHPDLFQKYGLQAIDEKPEGVKWYRLQNPQMFLETTGIELQNLSYPVNIRHYTLG